MKIALEKILSCGLTGCAAALFLSGCEGPMFEGTPFQKEPQRTSLEVMRVQSAQDQISADIQRLSGQISELSRHNEQMEQRLTRLETSVKAVGETKSSAYDNDIAALRRDIQQTRAENASMRKQITDNLASRIDTVARQQTAAARQAAAPVAAAASTAKAAASTAARGSGYEHKVERGQTLTEIARGYNVSVQSILKANNIRNPSTIRVGQVLFIPDAK